MKIRILRRAQIDLDVGYRFYENREEGLGDYFLTSIESDIRSLRIFAGAHQTIQSYFRMVATRFPYSIFYRVEDSEVRVFAVIDNRTNPERVGERLN